MHDSPAAADAIPWHRLAAVHCLTTPTSSTNAGAELVARLHGLSSGPGSDFNTALAVEQSAILPGGLMSQVTAAATTRSIDYYTICVISSGVLPA